MSDCIYRFGEFVLDAGERMIWRAGKPVALTPKAFDLLVTLVERHPRLVGKEELLSRLWPDTFVEETNLTYNMSMLRKALGDSAEQSTLIETVPKRGYRFVAAVSTTPENAAGPSPAAPVAARPAEPRTAGRGRRALTWWAGITMGALLLAAGGWRVAGRYRRGVDFDERSLVLVTEFLNRTGDSDLDGVVETALEAELARESSVGIAPRERANDALRLMRRPPASRVPASLAREVCLRDPIIRTAITGNIRKIGPAYFLAAEIIRPADGSVVSSTTRSAADKDAILSAVRAVAADIRSRLREESPDRDAKRQSLQKVTTDSLPALKLYSDAEAFAATHHWAEAEVLLRRAVQIDPQFASAHVLLAWAIKQQRPSAGEEFLPFAERALALADSTSERESFWIRGLYYTLSDQYRKAIPFYEAIVRRYPDHHPWASALLLASYRRSKQYVQATILSRELIRMRPNDPDAYLQAVGSCFCPPSQNPRDALGYLDRGMELARQRGDPEAVKNFRMRRAYNSALVAWVEGDVDRCRAELDQAVNMLPDDDWWIALAASGYMTLGQLERAERLLERIADVGLRLRWGTWRALLAGDMIAARRMAAALKDEQPNPLSAIAMIRAGEVEAAARMMKRWPPALFVDSALIAQGELSLRLNQTGTTAEALSEAVRSISSAPLGERWLGSQILAEVHLVRGNPDWAISALEPTGRAPRACGGFPAAVFWPQARYDLMLLYRRQNRFSEAVAIRKELDRLLKLADAGYAIRAALAGQ